jgi:hypothetical protein
MNNQPRDIRVRNALRDFVGTPNGTEAIRWVGETLCRSQTPPETAMTAHEAHIMAGRKAVFYELMAIINTPHESFKTTEVKEDFYD